MIANLWIFLRAHWLLLLGAAIVGGALGTLLASRQQREYLVYGQIELPSGQTIRSTDGEDTPASSFDNELPLLDSDRILSRVIDELKLASSAEFLGGVQPHAEGATGKARLRTMLIDRLRGNLHVSNVSGTSIARIEYRSSNERLAGRIVDTMIDDYVADRYERRFAAAHGVSEFLLTRVADLRQEVNDTQRQLLNLQQDLGAPGFSPRSNPFGVSLAELEDREILARLASLAAEGRARDLHRDAANMTSGNAADRESATLLARLRLNLAFSRSALAGLLVSLGPKNPQVEAAQADVEVLEDEMQTEYRRREAGADARLTFSRTYESELQSALDEQKRKIGGLQSDFSRYANLERQYVFARRLYFLYVERLRWSEASAALSQGDIYVIDHAVATEPEAARPPWVLVSSWSLLCMALMAVLLALRSLLRSEVRQISRLENMTGLRALANLPQIAEADVAATSALLAAAGLSRVADPRLEAFAQGIFDLRQQLERLTQGETTRCLVFTSSLPAEGKTTISSSVAVAMARHGRRVLLIDADLHRPALQRHFGLTGSEGLSSVLTGHATLEEVVQTPLAGFSLDVMLSGPMPPDPGALLDSEALRELLRAAAQHYAVIVIDTPPLLHSTDALVVARYADALVWVVRLGRASGAALRRADQLMETHAVEAAGIVVNGTRNGPMKLSPVGSEAWGEAAR